MWGVIGSLSYLFLVVLAVIVVYVILKMTGRLGMPEIEITRRDDYYVVVCHENCGGRIIAEDADGKIVYDALLKRHIEHEVPASAVRLYVTRHGFRYVYDLAEAGG